jgi:hypothetical protein
MGSETKSIESLNSGQSSSTKTAVFTKSQNMQGSGSAACASLGWWASTYTATVTADSAYSVIECNENNNVQQVSATPT